jgi:3-oxoacyl-[acyl-carrier-protein] synthase III
MTQARIKAISYWLPEEVITNASINQQHPEWSIDKIAQKTGIMERHISTNKYCVSDMALYASEKLFAEHMVDRQQIDFLLLCTQSPDYFLPTTACIVQDKLGLRKSIGALDFNLGCSGYVYGLGIAKGLVESGSATNVLLITSETYSKFIHPDDKSNKTIFGDAAAATLISSDTGLPIGQLVYGTDGSGAENLIVRNGGIKHRESQSKDILNEEDGSFLKNDNYLFMNGGEIFNFTAQNVPLLVNDVLQKNKLLQSEIDLFIFHQANRYMLDFMRKKIGIPNEKFFYFLENCGNTVSSTIPIALNEAITQNLVNPQKKVLLAGFGVGYSWAACILGET